MSKQSINDALAHLDTLKEEDIDYTDAPALDDSFFHRPRVTWPPAVLPVSASKQAITIKLDADLLRWLKSQGKGYQTRINALLRQYMEQQLQHQG